MFICGFDESSQKTDNKFVVAKPLSQNFPFPSGIFYYLTHAPSSWKGYQKLLRTCKYFIFKKFIFIVDDFIVYDTEQRYLDSNSHLKEIDALSSNLVYKIWLTKSLRFFYWDPPSDIIARLEKNIYKYNLVKLEMKKQILTYNEYLKLTESGSIEKFSVYESVIYYEDRKMVPFECLMKTLPNVVELICSYITTTHSVITSTTFKNMAKLLPFKMLKRLQIYDKRPVYESKDLCDFILKNRTNVCLDFTESVSDEWYNIIENYFTLKDVQKVSIEKWFSYRTPYFLLPIPHENWTCISIKF